MGSAGPGVYAGEQLHFPNMGYFVAMYLVVGFFSLLWIGRESVASALSLILRKANVSRGNKPLILTVVMLAVIAVVLALFVLVLTANV